MKTDGRKIYTQAHGAQIDLVIELFEGERLIPYCCKMMENNTIPGLLPIRHQILDGLYILKYNMSGKLCLQDFLMQRKLSYEQGVTLLSNLTDSLLKLGDYFLSAGQCILDPQQIYVGDGLRPYLICLPLEKEDDDCGAEDLQEFYEKLLSSYFATAECTDYDEMFKWVYRASPFDLSALQKKFLHKPLEEESVSASQQEIGLQPKPFDVGPIRQAEKTTQKKAEMPSTPEQPVKAGVLNIPGGGSFAMPGAEKTEKENKKEEKKQKPEKAKKKKGFWPFGSHNEVQQEAQRPATPTVPPAQSLVHPEQRLDEKWERGTILVTGESDGGTVYAGGIQGDCYLMYKGTRIEVTTFPFVIGKQNSTRRVDYAIFNNSNISRQHASILKSGESYMVQDNHSLNGTFVNGERLAPDQTVPLKEGDEIRLYNETFVFHLSRYAGV